MTTEMQQRYRQCLQELKSRGQQHVLRWWEKLEPAGRDRLLTEIETLPWALLDGLVPTHVLGHPSRAVPHDLAPPVVYPQQARPGEEAVYEDAVRRGRDLIRAGKVAAFTVAGGEGSRLGVDGPKGEVEVTPVGARTLFELLGGMIHAARSRYDAVIPWYVMSSPANHDRTIEYFRSQQYFGLPPKDVMIFPQGMLPAFDFQGSLLLAEKHRLALAPDGHGGSLKALDRSGALEDMGARGVEIISYFQVDNPLVKPIDPLFIGLHAQTSSEMSAKVTPKANDFERVGTLCMADDRLTLIEYSEFPQKLAAAKNPDGSRMFDAGNPAIHILNVAFVGRLIADCFALPVRRAEKAVPFVDKSGVIVKPTSPNAVKLETFVFDALPLAKNPLLLKVARAEEFSPVKNATGVDSLETAMRAQNQRACRWLEAAGATIPRRPDGEPDVTVAIAPSFALDAQEVIEKADRLPALTPGDTVYIE